MGGKNPQVVFPDADLDAALEKVVFGAYFNQGECCNAVICAPGWVDSHPPTSPPPCTRLTTPGGSPSSCRIWTRRVVVPGVRSLGFTTAEHPTASANGSFCETIRSGKFHGVIDPDDADRFLDGDREVVGDRGVVGIAVRVLGQRCGVVPDAGGAADTRPSPG